MCGRYALYAPHSQLRARFNLQDNDPDLAPRFNIAPTARVPVIRQNADSVRTLELARWGLVPSWIKPGDDMPQPINAKVETAAIKPMFRHAFRASRILVPANCFYEWKGVAGQKDPYLIRMRDQGLFGMAGLLERHEGPGGPEITFAILTTTANPLVATIHDRMPVIVRPEDYDRWLAPDNRDVESLLAIAGPYPEREMETFRIDRRINHSDAEGADLIQPVLGDAA